MPSLVKEHIKCPPLPALGAPTDLLFAPEEFIGVEFEYEGLDSGVVHGSLDNIKSKHLNVVNDYSLKISGCEILFKKAKNGTHIIEAMDELNKLLAYMKKTTSHAPYIDGNRCSTHIHINITDLSLDELYRFLLFAYFCEGALMDTCAGDRRNNVFTIGIDKLDDYKVVLGAVQKGSLQFTKDHGKYRAIGLNSMYSIGSLEFRMFNATTDTDQVLDWINFIQEIKHIAVKNENIMDAIIGVMNSSPDDVMKSLFSRQITLSEESRSYMWDFARDFYAQPAEFHALDHKFSPFYLEINGE